MDDCDTGYFRYEPMFVTEDHEKIWYSYLEQRQMASNHAVLPNGLTVGEAAVLYCRSIIGSAKSNSGNTTKTDISRLVYDVLPRHVPMADIATVLLPLGNKKPNKRSLASAIRRVCECHGLAHLDFDALATSVLALWTS